MNLLEKAKNLPSTPGVYLMKDSHGDIIYVGKSKILKNRVSSYFQNLKSHSQKILKMKKIVKDFEYILTDTEFEAFLLECKLIKDIKPIFNKMMKSPQRYTYIVIQKDETRAIKTTNTPNKNDGNLYFGPYTSKHTTERALQGIKEYFKIHCSNPSNKTECLNYSLGLCLGMCHGGQAIDQYHQILDQIIAILSGTDTSILKDMKNKMKLASENFDFEAAAKYRDYIDAVSFLLKKEKVIEFTEHNKNIVMVEYLSDDAIKLFLIKRNKVLFSERYSLTNKEGLISEAKSMMLTYFKMRGINSLTSVSKDEIDEAQIIYSYLKNNSCRHMVIPQKWLSPKYNEQIDVGLAKFFGEEKIKAL